MSFRRKWVRVALVVAALVVVANLPGLLFEGPEGPRSSSFATSPEGLAAYADLLQRSGHPVSRLRTGLSDADLDPATTLVVLDPGPLDDDEIRSLRSFLADGGRLIAGGVSPQWAAGLVPEQPQWSATGPRDSRVLVPTSEAAGVEALLGPGFGSWSAPGGSVPVLGSADKSTVAVAEVGEGRVVLLADSSFLQNQWLGRADNAGFGLAAAGERGRPVVFAESVHGYGSGLAAIPAGWRWALAGMVLAALVFMWARGRRLGPPEAADRRLAPPRRVYVESLGSVLARTKDPPGALEPLQAAARARLAAAAGLTHEATEADLREAAARRGLPADEIGALFGAPRSEAEVLAAGRALARVNGRGFHRDGGRG